MSSLKRIDGRYFSECEVVMTTTNKPSSLVVDLYGDMIFRPNRNSNDDEINKFLYILSPEKIKVGEYLVSIFNGKIQYIDICTEVDDQGNGIINYNGDKIKWTSGEHCRKIVATTDEELRINSTIRMSDFMSLDYGKVLFILPRPSDSFLKKYVEEYKKKNTISSVMVEYEWWYEDAIGRHWFLEDSPRWKTLPDQKTIDFYDKRIYLKTKVDSSDTITIKKKEVHVYSEEEVLKLLEKCRQYCKDGWKYDNLHRVFFDYDNWLLENLKN